MQKSIWLEPSQRPDTAQSALFGGLSRSSSALLMKLPLKSYDTNFHIFFASHYVHHWFDPWNAKWYAGFSQTTYPPLPQQWVAISFEVVRARHGLHGGATRRHSASRGRCLSLFAVLGGPARRIDCRACECFSWVRELSCLLRGATWNDIRGADLSECASVLLSMASTRQDQLFR